MKPILGAVSQGALYVHMPFQAVFLGSEGGAVGFLIGKLGTRCLVGLGHIKETKV